MKKAAENRKKIDPSTGKKMKVPMSVVEAFGNDREGSRIPIRDLDETIRLEYRTKLLNPKWKEAMLRQGPGGVHEVSLRAMIAIGWAGTAQVDNFIFEQTAQQYALDENVAASLQKVNPQGFKNIVRRLLEAAGRGMWTTEEATVNRLREQYTEIDDIVERG